MRNACLLAIALALVTSRGVLAAGAAPLPRAMELEGLHAYAEKIVTAGETIRFRISSTVPYELSVCRLGWKVDDPAGDEVLFRFAESPPVRQAIHPGSYVHVEKGLAADKGLGALTLECWVRPWRAKGWQTLISQYDYPSGCGYGLFVDVEGHVQFYLGDGGKYRQEWASVGPPLDNRRWQHVVGTWDGKTKALWIDGKPAGRWEFDGPLRPGAAALRLAGCGYDGAVVNLLDGDLAMPVIYGRALKAEEIVKRFGRRGFELGREGDSPIFAARKSGQSPGVRKSGQSAGVLTCWPMTEERGERVADVSGNERHGQIVNCATWMIGGPGFDGSKVPRYGDYDPAKDPRRGHGLRFASDDLYDCRWQVAHEYRIPKSAKPGIYVGRFRFDMDGIPRVYHVTFVVRRAEDRPKAPILAIASTNSWLAYKATPFAVTPPGLHYHWGTAGITNSPGNPPAYCMYRNHQAGQPAYKVGLNTPWPNAGPYVLYAAGGSGYSHLMRAERFALAWLEQSGYEYDVVGDWDVHRNPDLLSRYKVVLINGHGEYWSAEAYRGLDRYLRGGGNVLVLSGNVMVWRVSFNRTGTVMECRKLDPGLGGRPGCTVGELWHSQDRRRGSLMRECGLPPWKVIGLEMLGWSGIGPNDFGLYRVERPEHFLFNRPEKVGVGSGGTFGGAPGGGLPRAVGHECDVRLAVFRELTTEVPPGATLPEEPPGIVTLANGILPKYSGFDYFTRPIRLENAPVANMIYWRRSEGGRVFHAGSLGSGWGLSADPKFQTLIRNVLADFGVTPRS